MFWMGKSLSLATGIQDRRVGELAGMVMSGERSVEGRKGRHLLQIM